jgi:hypothetical protein
MTDLGVVRYVEFNYMGQAFSMGRYPVHWHMTGENPYSEAEGNAVWHTFNRAFTTHGTHKSTLRRNVAYNILGHAYFLEDGMEHHNTYEDNLGMHILPSFSLLASDQNPAVFWTTNPHNTWVRNHAAGSHTFGFWFDLNGSRFLKAPQPTHLIFLEIAMVAKLESLSAASSFINLVVAVSKVAAFMTMLTIMVIVCLCTSHAVPPYLPSWFVPAWKMLETLPLWEVCDFTIISNWVSQWESSNSSSIENKSSSIESLNQIANMDLVANIRIVLAQAPCCFWVVASVSSFFLILHALLTTIGFVGRCMRLAVPGVHAHAATTEASGDHLPAHGTESKISSPDPSQALVENKVMNIQTAAVTEEKKVDKKAAQKRVESPAPRATKTGTETNKEDIPPKIVSSLLQKPSEGHEDTKGAWKRNESPAPRVAKAAGMHARNEAPPAGAQSTFRKQEIQAHRQRMISAQHMAGLHQGVWNQSGNTWPGNVWQGGAWQGGAWQGANAWAGHQNGGQWGRNGW